MTTLGNFGRQIREEGPPLGDPQLMYIIAVCILFPMVHCNK